MLTTPVAQKKLKKKNHVLLFQSLLLAFLSEAFEMTMTERQNAVTLID